MKVPIYMLWRYTERYCSTTNRRLPSSRGYGTEVGLPCTQLAKIRAKDAPSHAVKNKRTKRYCSTVR